MAIGNSLTKREQGLLAIAMIAVLALGAYWYYVYTPASEEIDKMTAHVAALDSVNRKARNDMAKGNADSLHAEATRYAEELRVLRELVPTANELPSLLANVSTAARRVGLDLAGIEPLPMQVGEQFDTYRYKISVIGGYHEIGTLLSNVGSLRRIVAPVSLDLKPQQIPGEKGRQSRKSGESYLASTFEIQTYVVHTTPVYAAATTSTPPPGKGTGQ